MLRANIKSNKTKLKSIINIKNVPPEAEREKKQGKNRGKKRERAK